jgi:LCP family protein required for cell wall assembly
MQTEIDRSSLSRKRGGRNKRKWPIILSSLLLLIALAGGVIWWELDGFLNKITDIQETAKTAEQQAIPKDYNREPMSLVILGKDSRGDLGLLNTDVIIVATINPKTKKVTMVSLPRDTGVRIPGYKGYYKINSVFSKGESQSRTAAKKGEPITVTGTTLMKKTLEKAVGIPIQHYAMIDFEGFQSVIDELGGIEIDVEKSMKYDDPTDGTNINLEAGLQVLDGKEALDYVRHRMDNRGSKYYSTDFERGVRQQKVIKAMVEKMKSFTGISSFFGVLEVAGDHIRTDLSKDKIRGLIMDFKSVGSENITSLEIDGGWDGAHVTISEENMNRIQSAFQQEMGQDQSNKNQSTETVKSKPQSVPKKSSPPKNSAAPVMTEEAPKKQTDEEGTPEEAVPTEKNSGTNSTDSTSTNQPATQPNTNETSVQPEPTSNEQSQSESPPASTDSSGLLEKPVIPLEPEQTTTN